MEQIKEKYFQKCIFEKSVKGRRAWKLDKLDVPVQNNNIKKSLLRDKNIGLPEVSELNVVRHFTRISQQNFSIDTHFYPLGSCTMKYNPKLNEKIATFDGFTHIHPYQDEGVLWMNDLEDYLDKNLYYMYEEAFGVDEGQDAISVSFGSDFAVGGKGD